MVATPELEVLTYLFDQGLTHTRYGSNGKYALMWLASDTTSFSL